MRAIVKRRFGRPDLPPYARENLLPTHPYAFNDSLQPWYAPVAPTSEEFYEGS